MPLTLTDAFGTAMPPESMRETLRTRAMASTYFMGKAVCHFPDLDPDLHGMMGRWIQNPASNRKLALAPRGHLKTSLFTIADSCRLIVNDPNVRIAIFNEVFANASDMLQLIGRIASDNEVFRWLFPEVLPRKLSDVVWNEKQLEFKRTGQFKEKTVEAYGVGQASTSRHYSYIKEDDLCGKESQDSPATMKKAIGQHLLAESLLNAPTDHIHTYGTRWHPNDVPEWMLKNERNLDFLHLSIFRPDGTPIWPARFTPEYISELRAKAATIPGWFALQYENRTIATGATEFDPNWLRYWHYGVREDGAELIVLEKPEHEGGAAGHTLEQLAIYEMVDAAISPETYADRSAVVVTGLTEMRETEVENIGTQEAYDIVVLQADAERTSAKRTIARAWEAYERWHPILVGIETVSAHEVFFRWIPTVYPNMPLRRLKPDKNQTKTARIRPLGAFGQQGRIYVHRNMTTLIDEWSSFGPKGSLRDLLDALSYGPQIWAPADSVVEGNEYGDEDDAATAEFDGRSERTGY